MNANIVRALALGSVLTCAPLSAEEPSEATRVVYPSSATAKLPITIGIGRQPTVKPPVEESGVDEIDTPIGQIDALRETLEYLRVTQEREVEALEALLERDADTPPDRVDEIVAAIEQSASETQRLVRELHDAQDREIEPAPGPSASKRSTVGDVVKYPYKSWLGAMLFIVAWFIGVKLWKKAKGVWATLSSLAERMRRAEERDNK